MSGYRCVAQDKTNGGPLYRHLRQGRKCYRKGKKSQRSLIPNPVSIDERSREGDWELDTVQGKQGSGAIVSLLERKNRLYLVRYVPNKTASAVTDTIIDMQPPYKEQVHTITADNSSEFVEHERVSAALEAQVYFAPPYCAWKRGQNESSNRLLRQYAPKGSYLSQITPKILSTFERLLNSQPRKCLGFNQPQVIFDKLYKAA